jgi:hypothetical protein
VRSELRNHVASDPPEAGAPAADVGEEDPASGDLVEVAPLAHEAVGRPN